jgi:hypothetical protein
MFEIQSFSSKGLNSLMASEAGDMKLLGNFSKLIELISIDPNYNPANAKIKVSALTMQKTSALAAIAQVGTNEATFMSVTNERQEAYEGLPGVYRTARVPYRTARVSCRTSVV